MKILMLGWEYPPHISGGLGTACEGLTRGLAKIDDVEIIFVVPYLYGGEEASHMYLIDSLEGVIRQGKGIKVKEKISTFKIPANLRPYWGEEDYLFFKRSLELKAGESPYEALRKEKKDKGARAHYNNSIFHEVANYTQNVAALAESFDFDVIHAHDWMTYSAGVALKLLTGKPLVVHVHSLEYDRSGDNYNARINRIERFGVSRADKVIAVSEYTKSIVHKVHKVELKNIIVVHNGIYPKEILQEYRKHKDPNVKNVLFLGRVTYQKGPNYFIDAAVKVIENLKDQRIRFIMAGSGDMLSDLKEKVKNLGLSQHFAFPGFLKGEEVDKMLSVADLYVMPSVSEPFGISALEAINYEIPALISKQSGAAEVLHHTLKFDFWDVERFADLMINSLKYEEMREEMTQMAKIELCKLRWEEAAQKTKSVYDEVYEKTTEKVA